MFTSLFDLIFDGIGFIVILIIGTVLGLFLIAHLADTFTENREKAKEKKAKERVEHAKNVYREHLVSNKSYDTLSRDQLLLALELLEAFLKYDQACRKFEQQKVVGDPMEYFTSEIIYQEDRKDKERSLRDLNALLGYPKWRTDEGTFEHPVYPNIDITYIKALLNNR